jgi:hypothetical protein
MITNCIAKCIDLLSNGTIIEFSKNPEVWAIVSAELEVNLGNGLTHFRLFALVSCILDWWCRDLVI